MDGTRGFSNKNLPSVLISFALSAGYISGECQLLLRRQLQLMLIKIPVPVKAVL